MVRVSVSFIVCLSFVSTALTVAKAFFLKKQFYPSVIYLTKSNTSMAVIYFQAAVVSYLIFSLLRLIFFGQLRVAEVEHAQERVWHAILETCLAFTVFRDDFSPKFVVQFVVLLFVKAFHWLTEDRVDYMERSPVITVLYHARIMGILSLISAIDSYFISYAFFTTMIRGATAQVVFGFEYAILLTAVIHIAIKYILYIHDLRSAHPWENKAVYMLYAELFVNFMRCLLYMAFAIVMFKIHTLPLFAIRPFYTAIRALQKAINDVIQSRRAINAMNNLFPLATAEELATGDNTCIICREEMAVESGAKKLPCNHIFHPNCLRSWFQRQQTCPTCRTDVLGNRHPTAAAAANRAAFGGAAPPGVAQVNFGAQANFFNPANFGMAFGPFGGFPPQNLQQQPQDQQPAGVQPVAGGTFAAAAPQPPQQQHQPNALMGGGFNMFPFMFPPLPPPPFLTPFFGMPPPPPQFLAAGFPQAAPNGNLQPVPASNASENNVEQPSTSENTSSSAQHATGSQQAFTSTATSDHSSTSSALPTQQQQSVGAASTSFPLFGSASPLYTFPRPPTFAGFSHFEITEMEGHERGAVEARVQALRNISVLLDAAMLQFQQYLSIVSTPSSMINSTSPSISTTTTEVAPVSAINIANKSQSASSSSTVNETTLDAPTSSNVDSTSNTDTCGSSASDEIRRRRLEKFDAHS